LPWLHRRLGFKLRANLWWGSFAMLLIGWPAACRLVPLLDGSLAAPVVRVGAGLGLAFAFGLAWRLLVQFPGVLFDRFKLRTRLVISYVLVAAVPVLLVTAFLIVAAYLAMGSSRADTATRLLMPGVETRRALTGLLRDPALNAALAADRHPDDLESANQDLDLAVANRLAGRASFVMAARRSRADTSRFVLRFAPEKAVPPALRALAEPIPPLPADGLVYADSLTYATTALANPAGDDEILLRAFVPVDTQRLSDVAAMVSAKLDLFTSESLSVKTPGRGIDISFDSGQKGRARRVMSSDTPQRGGAQGAYVVRGFVVKPDGSLSTYDSILLLQIPAAGILTSLRDTASNPINYIVLLVLGVIAGLFLLVESGTLWAGTQIARQIHQAVLALHQGTRRIAEEDFDHRIEIERGDELGELGQAFNAMAEGLKERRQLALEQQALQSEMLVARSIQRRLFPEHVPAIAGLDVAGTSIPSREIGGDAYDYLPWEAGLLVSVADVSGKGVPAALLMSNLQAGLRGQAHRPAALGNVLAELNELILASTDPGQFITLAIAYVNPGANRLVYASAGHNPPFLRRRNGAIEPLTESGLLLGVVEGAEYAETAAAFNPGDTLVLYTDGVVEAQDTRDHFYGDDRLTELLRNTADLDASAIRDRIVESVKAFAGSEGPGDDLTVVVVRRI
jgi:serine phosphatase RsbU (regulator of sigma subunit)